MEQSTIPIETTVCETVCKSGSMVVGKNNCKVKIFPLEDKETPEMENQSRPNIIEIPETQCENFDGSENRDERNQTQEQEEEAIEETEDGDCIRSLESDSGSCGASTSFSESQIPSTVSHWKSFFRVWKQSSMRRLSTFPPKLSRRIAGLTRDASPRCKPPDSDFYYFKPSWKNFSLAELKTATDSFSPENLIGKGGYAEVYKGCLQDGQLVAVKRLTRGTTEERIGDFLSELGIIVHIDHPNAAKLIGFGVEGGMHLVLKLSPHGSLASLLHGSKQKLDWGIRHKIALGTAEGLLYLHESCQRRIIHRDIKASNILLTEDFEPQISDFGLAKWLPDQWTHHTMSKFEGTFGYLAPEYIMHGIVDEKTDVFAFGVLLLELITGRQAINSSQQSLVMSVKPLLEKNEIRDLADPTLGEDYDLHQMSQAALTASACIQHSPIQRPRMSQVLQLLKGEEGGLESMLQCQKPNLRRTYSEELFDAEEYNTTKYLNDLNRHRKLAMEF